MGSRLRGLGARIRLTYSRFVAFEGRLSRLNLIGTRAILHTDKSIINQDGFLENAF
jgi:hypothetical protein